MLLYVWLCLQIIILFWRDKWVKVEYTMRILYIDVDSLRPDHLGCYGYHRRTSPAIDQIASEGAVFERVYASDAPCLPSRTALYSGRFGIQSGVVTHGGFAADPKSEGAARGTHDIFRRTSLPAQLQKLGYHTAMISPFPGRHAAWQFYAGFNETHDTGRDGDESAEVIRPVVDRWLAQHATEDNWYLHVNYWDPHTPYRTPLERGDRFADDPLPAWLDDDELIRKHNAMAGPHTSLDISMYHGNERPDYPRQPGEVRNRADMRRLIDGYDMGVEYVDEQIAGIVNTLKQAGIYDDTLIILSADHGENLGELGIYAEHGTADEATCHIPLIIKFPGLPAGQRDSGLHYNIDLGPTLMDLLGGDAPTLWDGQSFADAVRSGQAAGREDLVVSQCCHVCQRSVRWDNWLYMRTYHCGFHLFPQEMLFDLATDPHEQHNIAEGHPDLCREGAWRLARWHDEQMQKMSMNHDDISDPLWTVMREGGPYLARLCDEALPGVPGALKAFEKYLARLEETGRRDGADALRARYAERIKTLRRPIQQET